jgi:multiple sugar transport system ATP-binding protein
VAVVELVGVRKVYPNGFEAVPRIDLTVGEGELVVLVGPSGCGKTTVLRMVAGLEDISDGEVRIGGKVVNDRDPRARDIAMVFQNYALYPHMTVAQNIGFALKLQKLPKQEIAQKVQDAAHTLGLTQWLERKPAQLSGGQRQRVAMGRAIVRDPAVFLMDEPLSNLDAKLRVQMRSDVMAIQRRVGVATVYVTHDQVEAMTMGDRVAVMKDGVLQQVDKAQVLYDQPANLFVAGFIGSPAMNLYEAELGEGASSARIGSSEVAVADNVRRERPALAGYAGRTVVVGIRPEGLTAIGGRTGDSVLRGRVRLVEALGNEQQAHFTIDAKRVVAEGAGAEDAIDADGVGVARVAPHVKLDAGENITLSVDTTALHFFDPETGNAIWA